MTPMDRIRQIALTRYKGMNRTNIAASMGIARNTLYRFLNGRDGSFKAAQYMAKTYGGECAELFRVIKEEDRAYRSLNVARGRKKRLEIIRGEHTPYPSMIVDMVTKQPETHHMPPINNQDILCYNLPVLHPQPEIGGYWI